MFPFYLDTHKEGGTYASYHYPGFQSTCDGFPKDELQIMNLVKASARSILAGRPICVNGESSFDSLFP
jgi:hypothetical protein